MHDGAAKGETISSNMATVKNSPPTLKSVRMNPEQPLSTQDLRCQVDGARDLDGDEVKLAWQWFQGTTDLQIDGPVLAADQTKRDLVYRCVATPSDGTVSGESVAAERTVSNVAPVLDVADRISGGEHLRRGIEERRCDLDSADLVDAVHNSIDTT